MSSVVSSSARQTEAVESLYELRGPEEVLGFLRAHPFLVPLLEEAHGRLRERFSASRLFLQVLSDPEDPANSQLVAFVAIDSDPAVAFQNLQDLDASWWLSAMDRAQGKFHINLETA